MKTKGLLFLALLFATACSFDPMSSPKLTTELHMDTQELVVPIKSGYTTYVTFGSDTLAIADKPMTITVPKAIATKAGEDIHISYSLGHDPRAGSWQMWQTISFEDSKVGDYDYNDLIVHCKYEYRNERILIGIHPIALGSTKKISLGCKILVGEESIFNNTVVEDCRAELFDGQEGFINTLSKTPNFYKSSFAKAFYARYDGNINAVRVIWYIVVDGTLQLYAVNNTFNYLNKDNRPYGILTTATNRTFRQEGISAVVGYNWFAYPLEGKKINDCYPTYDRWISGKGTMDFRNFVADDVFDIENQRIYEVDTYNSEISKFIK